MTLPFSSARLVIVLMIIVPIIGGSAVLFFPSGTTSKSPDAVLLQRHDVLGVTVIDNPHSFDSVRDYLSSAALRYADDALISSREMIIDTSADQKALGYSGQRKVVEDMYGNLYIAYRKQYGGHYHVYVSELKRYGEDDYILKRLAEPISNENGAVSQRVPGIALDGRNRIHAVWYGSTNPLLPAMRQIHYSYSSDGSNIWLPSKMIGEVEGYTPAHMLWQEHPDIYAGKEGEVFVAWEGRDSDHKRQQIKFTRSLDSGRTWSTWKNIAPSPDNTQSRPTVLYDDAHYLHLLMYSSRTSTDGTAQIQYVYSDDEGDTWSEWRILSSGTGDARHISATDKDGVIHVVYRGTQSSGTRSQIYYVYGSGSEWSPPVPVTPPSEGWQFFPSIGVSDDGTLCVTYTEASVPSDFPNEELSYGTGFYTCRNIYNDEGFLKPMPIGEENNTMFVQLPAHFHNSDAIPVIYYHFPTTTIRLRFVE